MKQTIHIFRKDVRHLWREIAASVGLMAGYVWCVPATWTAPGTTRSEMTGLLNLLLPLSWGLLVVRAVQDEAPVGDRQFWVTRPYRWKELLTAKLLFVVVFVNLPLLIADAMLLWIGGFPETSSRVLGLLWLQLLWAGLALLPMTALAVVTASVAQMALAILAVVLYFVSWSFLSSKLSPGLSTAESIPNLITMIVLLGACAFVTVWQYARRRTGKARGLLLGALVAVIVIAIASPHRLLVAHEYPQPAPGQPPSAQFSLDPVKPPAPRIVSEPEKKVPISFQIPLRVTGIAEGATAVVDGTMVAIEGPDGFRWESGWQSDGSLLLVNNEHFSIGIMLDQNKFKRVQSAPVKLRISIAMTTFRDKEKVDVLAQDGDFEVKDLGLCTLHPQGWMDCRYALRRPSFMVSTSLSAMTCPGRAATPLPNAAAVARTWEGGTSGAAEFSISPVKSVGISMRNWEGDVSYEPGESGPHVCAGTPLTFTFREATGRSGAEFEIDGLNLADYRLHNGADSMTGIAAR